MKDRLKGAIGTIHADSRLKETTKAYITEKVYKAPKAPLQHLRRYGYALCTVLIVCIFFAGYHIYFTPTSLISIDINPSIELSVNRFDQIVGVRGVNEDGVAVADGVTVLFQNYQSAINEVMDNEFVQEILSEDGFLAIGVVNISGDQGEEIFSVLESSTANQNNTYCYRMDADAAKQAADLGMSCGRYQLYLKAKELIPELVPEELNDMSMREIKDLILTKSPDAEIGQGNQGNGYQHGKESQSGNGYGKGNGMNR